MLYKNATVYKIAGDKAPFFNCSKATYQRLGEVIIKYQVIALSSSIIGHVNDRGSTVVLVLEIPVRFINEVSETLKVSLEDPMDLNVGSFLAKSVKWIDEDGNRYTSLYPSKEEMLKD